MTTAKKAAAKKRPAKKVAKKAAKRPVKLEYVDVVVPIPKRLVPMFGRLAKQSGQTIGREVSMLLAVLLDDFLQRHRGKKGSR